jgi:hypothetical protein
LSRRCVWDECERCVWGRVGEGEGVGEGVVWRGGVAEVSSGIAGVVGWIAAGYQRAASTNDRREWGWGRVVERVRVGVAGEGEGEGV